jgi:hypothetical protein
MLIVADLHLQQAQDRRSSYLSIDRSDLPSHLQITTRVLGSAKLCTPLYHRKSPFRRDEVRSSRSDGAMATHSRTSVLSVVQTYRCHYTDLVEYRARDRPDPTPDTTHEDNFKKWSRPALRESASLQPLSGKLSNTFLTGKTHYDARTGRVTLCLWLLDKVGGLELTSYR